MSLLDGWLPSLATTATTAVPLGQSATAAPVRRVFLPAAINPSMPPAGARLRHLGGQTMGTSWQVSAVLCPRVDEGALQLALQTALDRVVVQMSPWEPAADVQRFAAAGAGCWVVLPDGCFQVLAAALEVAQASRGAFDPTVAPWVRAWGFGPPRDVQQLLYPQARQQRWRAIRLDPAQRKAWQPAALELDLCGIAKGFAVDELCRVLQASGVEHHLAEIGGELRGNGMRPDGQPWWVQLEPPDSAAQLPEALIALHGLAVATSGDYRRFRHGLEGQEGPEGPESLEGTRYSHTIDPASGTPVQHALTSVSVLHSSAMLADAWATALMVLGPLAGAELATSQGLAARLVCRPTGPTRSVSGEARGGWQEWLSPALVALQDTQADTDA